MSSKVSVSDCTKEHRASGRGSVELTPQVSTCSSAKRQRASGFSSVEPTSKVSTRCGGAKGQRAGGCGSSLCFSIVEATSKLLPSSSAEGLDRVLIQSPISAAMFGPMLSVPIKVEAQAAYNVLSVKHLDRIRSGLLNSETSALPWAILHERTFEHDVMMCGHCGGRLRLV